MAKIGVALKIDVSKIDKARLFRGKKGTYLDATAFIDLDQLDQYGNSGMITQDVSKEEKDQGVKGNILGNSKVFWSDSGGHGQQQPAQQAPQHNQGFRQKQAPVQQTAPAANGQSSAMTNQQIGEFGDDWDSQIPF